MTSAWSKPGELGGPRGDHWDQHHGRLHFLPAVAVSSCLSGLLILLLTHYIHHGHAIALIPIHTIIEITWCIVNVIIKMMISQTQLFCLAYSLSSLVTVEEEGNSEVQHPSKQSYLDFFSPFRSSAYIWKFRAPPSTSPTPTLFCRQSPRTPSSPSSASCSSSPSSTSSLSSSTSSVAPWSR